MNPRSKKLLLIPYLAIVGALLVNDLMGLGWFGRFDKVALWGAVAVAVLVGGWLKSRAEEKARSGEVVIEALDSQGAVRSDPGARRFVWRAVSIVGGITLLVVLASAFRDRNQDGLVINALVGMLVVTIASGVCWNRFGNISEIEGDDGVTLTFRRRGQIVRVPWRQVESVEVSRPYAFWQVVLKFRQLGESKPQAIRFLPLGWQKMTPPAAEKLQSALEQRRTVQ